MSSHLLLSPPLPDVCLSAYPDGDYKLYNLWDLLYWNTTFGLRTPHFHTFSIIIWLQCFLRGKDLERANMLDTNIRKSMVKCPSWAALVPYLTDLLKWYFEAPIKGQSNFLSGKLVGIWHHDIHGYICLVPPGEGTGMFDNPTHVFRCWSSWTLKNQVSNDFVSIVWMSYSVVKDVNKI